MGPWVQKVRTRFPDVRPWGRRATGLSVRTRKRRREERDGPGNRKRAPRRKAWRPLQAGMWQDRFGPVMDALR